MTYIPRRDITNLIPNKFEAIRVLALECRRLNDEIRAREETEVEGKLTTLAVSQMLEGKVTYYDAKERREQERSEAMLSAAEGLLDIAEPMIEPDFEAPVMDDAVSGEEAPAEAPAEVPVSEDAPSADSAVVEKAEVEEMTPAEAPVEEPVAEAVVEPVAEAAAEAATEDAVADEPAAEEATETTDESADETKKEPAGE